MIYKPKGRNSFCGPIAMSSLFRISSHYAAKLIRESNDIDYVKGLYPYQLTRTLSDNGVLFNEVKINKTYNQFLKQNHSRPVILEFSEHFIAYDKDCWTDSGLWAPKRKLYSHNEFPSPRSIVKVAYFILSHNIVEPKKSKISSSSIDSFTSLLFRCGSPGLLNEFEHYEDFINEIIDDHFGEGTSASLIESEIKKKYCSIFIDDFEGKNIDDLYYWDLLNSDVKNSPCLHKDDLQSLKTIFMLNAKYKFVS
jgi:hypothetical protein